MSSERSSNQKGSRDERPKGGRPPKDESERRTITQSVHLSEEEKEEIERRADRAGLSVSAFFRKRALGKDIKTKVEENVVNELNRIGVNVNQLARWANRGQGRRVQSKLDDVIADLKAAIKRLQ